MDEFINKDIEDIKLKLDLIINQNCDIQNKLGKVLTALSQTGYTENCNKAVEEFLNEFMNNVS